MWGHKATDRRKQVIATNCIAAMDIVFLIDYTGSMSSSINMVKQSIASLLETIEKESNNDYRLSLILFDESNGYSALDYINKPAYTSLPSDQRIVQGNVYITVLNKLSQNNYAETIDKLNILTTPDFPLGNGGNAPEPSDFTLKKVLYDNIAGTFREGVNKAIIIFTDAGPSGLNDNYSVGEDFLEMMNLAKISRDNGITVSTNFMQGTDISYNSVYTITSKITKGVFASGNSNIQVLKDLISNMCDNVSVQKPVVATTSVSNISGSGWTVSGNVTSAGTQPVTERGFLYSTDSTNILENASGVTKVINGTGTGTYTNNISQTINSGQTFYVRAYAKSVVGISYGDKLRVSTTPATAPSVNINSINVISGKLSASGTINSDGGSTLTERGFIYSTSNSNLTIGQPGVTKVIVPGLFSNYSMETPVTGTDYYVRAYAINSVGTSYSNIMTTVINTHFYVKLIKENIQIQELVAMCPGYPDTIVGDRETADFRLYFYSDAAGTVPVNVTSNTIVGVKVVYKDFINNISTEYVYNHEATGTNMLLYDDIETRYQADELFGYEGCATYVPDFYVNSYSVEPGNGYTVIT